jgi:hypothetical protein
MPITTFGDPRPGRSASDDSTTEPHFRVTTHAESARSVVFTNKSPQPQKEFRTLLKTTRQPSVVRVLLTAVAVTLTLTTAYIHLTLGAPLFTLNAVGYLGLAALVVIGASVRHSIVARFGWVPGASLAGYAAVTIVSYLIVGPYFALGWIAKAVELALIGVVAADLVSAYGSPADVVRAALGSLQFERRTT